MSTMDIPRDLKYVYGWNLYTMKFMGVWPQERKWADISSYIALTPILMMLCFVCVPQTINLLRIWGNFDLVVENLSMGNITITISLLKAVAFYFNGKSLTTLLAYMAKDWSGVRRSKDRDTMMSIARTTRTISMRSTLMSHSVVMTYVALRWFALRHDDHRLLFRAYFPYNVDESPNDVLTFLGQFVAAMYAATMYTAVDTFVAMLILHVCGQLSILRREIVELKARNKLEFRAKLRRIVRKHEYLTSFAGTIEDCFNVMLLVQMLGCTVQLCFQCFQALMSIDGGTSNLLIFQFLFLLLYVVYVLLQLYLYCYVGENLAVESTKIANAAYDCEWYNLPAEEAKSFTIIMCRAKSPLRITAGRFCSFNLELYSQVLKTSMGYMSVLYATKDKSSD